MIRRNRYGERREDADVFVENSTYARHHIKKRIREQNLIKYECGICGIGNIWCGKELILVLDHINGKNDDHRVSNMRFVCSNCDSQLPTYKNRRGKAGRVV